MDGDHDHDALDPVQGAMASDDDGSFDCPPPIDIPHTDARPLRRSRSAQHNSASSPCSSASPETSVATATPSRSSTSARALSDLRSDRELITLVCSSSKSSDEVDTLDLSSVAKKTRKALKSLRALADFVNLVHLDVSNNAIGSVDGIDAFPQLQVLTMSRNHLKRLGSPLFTLASLRHLDLSGNFISHLPRAIVHLEQLETLNVAGNSLSVLKEVDPLSKLANLHACNFTANPMCKLPTYKDYVICKLPSLEKLDDAAITAAGRDKSRRRFSDELFCKDSRLREAGLAHEHEQSKLRDAQSALEAENLRLKGELQVKSKLLQNKSKEWSSATGQLLQLQQELAMLHLEHRGSVSPGRLSTSSGVSSSLSVASTSPPRLSDSRVSATSLGSSRASCRSESFGEVMRASYSSYDDGFATAISDDELEFHLRQPLRSPSPRQQQPRVVNAAVSPLCSDLRHTQSSSTSSPSVSGPGGTVAQMSPTLDVRERAGREDMSSYSKRLIDSACSPLRRSPEKPVVGRSERSTSPHTEPSPPSPRQQRGDHFRHSFDSPGAPSPPPVEPTRPGRSKSFDAVRRAFADLSPERRLDAGPSLAFGGATARDADLTEDEDAMQYDLSMGRSGRFPTFEDDVACPAYEESASSAVHRSASWRQHPHRVDLPSDAEYSHARSRASPRHHDRLASPSPSPRSRAQRLWQRQHAEFRDETFGRNSPSKSPLKASSSLGMGCPPTLASPVDKTMLTRQIQALQSCKQSLVSEIAKEEQLLHALKHEASSYVSQMDQLQLEIQVALNQDSAAAAAAAASGVTAVVSPRGASSSSQRKQREEESYRAKLECCRSKLRFAEDKEREIEMTMVRTTKRVLQSDLQHAPFDKEIFALTHKLQQVIVQKEEIHQEMSRLMVLIREQQAIGGGDDEQTGCDSSPRRRSESLNRSMFTAYNQRQQQTVDAMLEEEEQRQRLSEALQHTVALTRKRLDELQRRYQDVVERVHVKEDLIASYVEELKDVERELALIGQHSLATSSANSSSPHPRRQRSVSLDFHPYSPPALVPSVPSPSQTTMDAVEIELAEALQAIKDGRIDVGGTATATAGAAAHNGSMSTSDGPTNQSSSGSSQQQAGTESCSRQDASGSAHPPSSSSASLSIGAQDSKAPVSSTVHGSTASAAVSSESARLPSHEILLKELLTAEMLEEIKKDIFERLSKQLAAVAASATSASREPSRERSESLDRKDLHDAIAAALESQMKLALESFHKKRDEDSDRKKKQQQTQSERQRSAPSSPAKRSLRTARHEHSQQQQQPPQPGGDMPRDDDISCDHLDDFKPVDASYAVKYRFVKHHFSSLSSLGAPPSPPGSNAPAKSSRTTGAQRILKACERLEQAEHESRIDPISAIEVDPMGTKRSSLKVLLMGARDLPTTHLRTKNLDPYVSVEIVYPEHMTPLSSAAGGALHHTQGGATTTFRSRTVKKSVYPVWDEEFEFAPVHSLRGVLHVRILNDRKLSREQLVGEVRIPLRSLLSQKKTVEWFPLRFAVPSATALSSSSGGGEKDLMSSATTRKTNTVLRSSGGSIRLQLQLSYSRVEKYKRAVDELVTKFFHEHNHLPPFIEAVGERRSAASHQQNQEQHESDDYSSSASGFATRGSDNRRFGKRDDGNAFDELQQYHHHHQQQQQPHYQQQEEQHCSGVPEVESPGKDNDSTIPTFDSWRAEREADAAMEQQQRHLHQQRTRDMQQNEGGGRGASPPRTSADITIGAHAYDSSATHALAMTTPQLSAERSRQLWEMPVAREASSSGTAHTRSSHAHGHFTNERSPSYPTGTASALTSMHHQHYQHYVSHERATMYHTNGGGSHLTSTSSSFVHGSSRSRLTVSTKMPHSTGAGGASTPRPQAARAPGTLHHRPSKHSISTGAGSGAAVQAQPFNSHGRRRATTTGTHYAHHQPQRSERPECFDDYSPYHPDFQFTDVLDLYGGSNGNYSDLFAARTSKRKSGALHTWQATSRRGSSSGGVLVGLDDPNRKTDLRIFKSPGFARRQPSAGFPERYIGLDNQTCERLKRMFGRMDSGGSSSTTVG